LDVAATCLDPRLLCETRKKRATHVPLLVKRSRIEALAPQSDHVIYIWRNAGETEEEALERHYRAFPAERLAAQTYASFAASFAPHRAEEDRQDISSQPSKHRIAASQ
jgi:hypothetical protein